MACLQGQHVLAPFGATTLLGSTLARVVLRQVAPLLVALVLAAQAGSALAGSLVVAEQSEVLAALRVMGVDERRWIMLPNLVRAAIEGALLTAVGCAALVGGGAFVLMMLGESPAIWMEPFLRPESRGDLLTGVAKGALLGLLNRAWAIGAAWQPIRRMRNAEGLGVGGERLVGETTGRAVVWAIWCLAIFEGLWVFVVEWRA